MLLPEKIEFSLGRILAGVVHFNKKHTSVYECTFLRTSACGCVRVRGCVSVWMLSGMLAVEKTGAGQSLAPTTVPILVPSDVAATAPNAPNARDD